MATAQEKFVTREQWERLLGIVLATGQPQPLRDVVISSAITLTATPRPIDYFSGYLWGATSDGKIYRSSDMGENWTLVQASIIGSLNRMMLCSDGEIIATNGGSLYKSSGWAANPSTATFTKKFDTNGASAILQWGLDGNGTKFITTEYAAGGNFADSRYVRMTTDAGNTWDIVYDTVDVHGALANEGSHLHCCCYDPWDDVFYFTEGHSVSSSGIGGVWFSDDDGVTWTQCANSLIHWNGAYTVMVATKHGLVCGTDQSKNGIWILPRTTDIENAVPYLAWEWLGEIAFDSLNGFAIRGYRDPDTNLVYVGFGTGIAGVKCPIAASDGRTADLVYSVPSTGASGDEVSNLVVANGKLAGYFTDTGNTVTKTIRANVSNALRIREKDTSNILAALNCSASSVVVGATADGGSRPSSVLVGQQSTLSGTAEKCVVSGFDSHADEPNCIIIGPELDARGSSNQLYVGKLIEGTGDFQVGVGVNIDLGATGLLAFGSGIDLGAGSIAIGSTIDSGAGTIAVGRSITGGSENCLYGDGVVSAGAQVTLFGNSSDGDISGAGFGYNVSVGQYSAAFGHGSVAGGVGGSYITAAFGYDVDITATGGYGLGAQIDVTHAGSGVLGANLSSTAVQQLKIGPVHIELTEVASEPGAPASNDARVYAIDDGNGVTCLRVRTADGIFQLSPDKLRSYTVLTLPAVTAGDGALIYVTDETGGEVPAFCDGSNWLRITDRATVS